MSPYASALGQGDDPEDDDDTPAPQGGGSSQSPQGGGTPQEPDGEEEDTPAPYKPKAEKKPKYGKGTIEYSSPEGEGYIDEKGEHLIQGGKEVGGRRQGEQFNRDSMNALYNNLPQHLRNQVALQYTQLGVQEQMQLQRQQNALGQIRAEVAAGNLTKEAGDEAETKLLTGISPLVDRQQRAKAMQAEFAAQQMQQQLKEVTQAANMVDQLNRQSLPGGVGPLPQMGSETGMYYRNQRTGKIERVDEKDHEAEIKMHQLLEKAKIDQAAHKLKQDEHDHQKDIDNKKFEHEKELKHGETDAKQFDDAWHAHEGNVRKEFDTFDSSDDSAKKKMGDANPGANRQHFINNGGARYADPVKGVTEDRVRAQLGSGTREEYLKKKKDERNPPAASVAAPVNPATPPAKGPEAEQIPTWARATPNKGTDGSDQATALAQEASRTGEPNIGELRSMGGNEDGKKRYFPSSQWSGVAQRAKESGNTAAVEAAERIFHYTSVYDRADKMPPAYQKDFKAALKIAAPFMSKSNG